ncbi:MULTISPECIES: 3-phosphoshikimate 1-carboxyvinyltransferase [unclassified Oceanispirochaeta]|uniref:3-phosphoshikimate 1-carboxyvinyltransferase n=1 Tax=unclassified Oceanispirochaeta TaxID=2635722 RepID=UPI000E093FE0|nr:MULTISPECIES: 3-phosphoshikimate 1-carboxyvinyltransferase [unclassified Oceanispirochaeta]MBF9015382.1 3-phosphoshikimate 1-carboxyvinyltransferase [Oceanispirochaeta sp. M2]NPD71841.1 3-phosphoshikimate 1-carboxyvinyltransferase [Oceanispirochaeta sp. M1]RDG32651.1 3-phosphoshikimate 1-carboxyvinyltransferase [Oceanispirochaeta sp. M1]
MSTVTIKGKSIASGSPITLRGSIQVPASKSHTIRALLIGSLAEGSSRIHQPLYSADTLSCLDACRKLGAVIEDCKDGWKVLSPIPFGAGEDVYIDVGNSGTSLYLLTAIAAVLGRKVHFDGDDQIRSRSAGRLLNALKALGAEVESSEDGYAPYWVKGPLKGGECSIECPTSQYLSALLLAAPLLESSDRECRIKVPLLMEQPYAEMTLKWMERQNIRWQQKEMKEFTISGGQKYRSFDAVIAADFSSATFFFCAAALTGSTLLIKGLDMEDSQGDKAVLDYLSTMGASIRHTEKGIEVRGGQLKGAVLDLNDTPDALPAMAVTACYAKGETRIINVPQARMKETDRISVMTAELRKMGAEIEETPDGMIIQGSPLTGNTVKGHGDHRVVMSLAIASLGAVGETVIDTAEAVNITYPGFFEQFEILRP